MRNSNISYVIHLGCQFISNLRELATNDIDNKTISVISLAGEKSCYILTHYDSRLNKFGNSEELIEQSIARIGSILLSCV